MSERGREVGSVPMEPGYVPPVSYDDPSEYEPYPEAPADLPFQVEYETPGQAIASTGGPQVTLPQAVVALVRKVGQVGGREDRTTFWLGAAGIVATLAVLAIVAVTVILVAGSVLGAAAAGAAAVLGAALLVVAGLASLVTLVSGGVRRLHDTGLPGWLLALWFVPLGWIAVLVLLARQGQARTNGFGPSPDAR